MSNTEDIYESEISNGKNLNSVKCKHCNSKILNPQTAEFCISEFGLPFIRVSPDNCSEAETISSSWVVTNIYTFENVGFSKTVGTCKYLMCADCDGGPIGYHDLDTKKSYIALSRVIHG